MSTKKIKSWNADNIAEKIAKKAFEHLIGPIEQQQQNLARLVYGKINDEIHFSHLISYGVVKDWPDEREITVFIDVYNGSGQEQNLYFESRENEPVCTPIGWNQHFKYTDDEVFDLASELQERLTPLEVKRHELKNTLKLQLVDKTVKQAVTAWPEAASIIYDIMGVEGPKAFVTPLEELLARFLPMLPAPSAA